MFFYKERMFSFWCVNRRRAPREGCCKYHHFSSGPCQLMLLYLSTFHKGWIQEYVLEWDTREDVRFGGIRKEGFPSTKCGSGQELEAGSRRRAGWGGPFPASPPGQSSRLEFSSMSLISIRGSLCTGDFLSARGAAASRDRLWEVVIWVAPAGVCPEHCVLPWLGGSQEDICRLPPPHLSTQGTKENEGHGHMWKEHSFGARQDWGSLQCHHRLAT